MNGNVLRSIFKRDFVSYFSSPTGYVFICVFVMLSSLATFWPPEFFASNLANLDQLSRWLPFIMLVFIPAITMSIWAEERHQGTDELLLTTPASDLDVVLGKYLAGVAIFTVSLMFSAFSIFLVFKWGLGDPDAGLFLSTYIGYWFIGIAMIAIGMVASFLTDNLTVGFILGMLFNLPLALAGVADWFIKDPAVAQVVRKWGALEQFRDFERGVISLGGATYFVMISVVMLYISMVLIGRRHWQARDTSSTLMGHYAIRAIALLCLAVGVTQLIQSRNMMRADISSEQLSSLSADTRKLLRDLRNDDEAKPIKIDAYVSPQVPNEYVATKTNFLSTLSELQALSGNKVQVALHEIENHGPEAVLAETTYGITPQEVTIVQGRERSQEEFFLAAAITAGLKKVVVPFIDKGIPVEYEMVRSISTVSKSKALKVGIVDTGVQFVNPSSDHRREWPLITELRKQYDVDDRPVDPSQPIKDTYDVLIAVQPSMLGPQELDHLVDAVRSGIPTAILEDPHPHFFPMQIASTSEPRRQQQGMMGMFGGGGQNIPKGDIQQLWRTLGIQFEPTQIVWQDYAPDQTVRASADQQWIFIDEGNGSHDPLSSNSPITSGMNQLLLPYPGHVAPDNESKLGFTQLVLTGSSNSGTVETFGLRRGQTNMRSFDNRTKDSYILAAHIQGVLPDDDLLLTEEESAEAEADASEEDEAKESDSDEETEQPKHEGNNINVVVVTDIDWIIPDFFYIRQSGDEQVIPATQNVTFILNIIDALAGDDRFIEIRKRTRKHRTLRKIDEATKAYRETARVEEEEFVKEIENQIKEAQDSIQDKIAAVENNEGLSRNEREQQKAIVQQREQDRFEADFKSIEANRRRKLKQIEYQKEQEIRGVEDRYKMFAILIPPIPPLLVALYVFFQRRKSEQEGIAKARLK